MNRFIQYLITFFAWISGIILVASIVILLAFLIYKGIGSLNLFLIFGETKPMDALLMRKEVLDGLFPAIVGTILLITASIVWAIPIGIASGIYLAEYCDLKWKPFFSFMLDLLAGIPSILVGLLDLPFRFFSTGTCQSIFIPVFLYRAWRWPALSFLISSEPQNKPLLIYPFLSKQRDSLLALPSCKTFYLY